MNRNPSTTIEPPCSHAASPTQPMDIVVDWILPSESELLSPSPSPSSLYINMFHRLLRLEFETEKMNHLGQHSDAISSMNWAREQSTCALPSSPLLPPLPMPILTQHAHRCPRNGLLGPDGALLGPPRTASRAILPQSSRASLPHGSCQQRPRRRDGEPPLPHLRHSQDGRACTDAREQPEVHDPRARMHGGWSRCVFFVVSGQQKERGFMNGCLQDTRQAQSRDGSPWSTSTPVRRRRRRSMRSSATGRRLTT